MPAALYRGARRAEARAQHPDDRRRLRVDYLRETLAAGRAQFRPGPTGEVAGAEAVHAHARLVDDILRALVRLGAEDASAEGHAPSPFVLAALGGYGRGELHPASDIDLMVIHEGEPSTFVRRLTREVLYTLWDLGLEVGHSVRSLEDCVAIGRTDLASRTSMQQARWLAGDRALFARLRRVLRTDVFRHDFEGFLEQTLAERDQRYRRHGASPYVGEPNIKESAGGLRDLHTALWLAGAKFGAHTLPELAARGLCTPREQGQADAALAFLWRARNTLHLLSGHKHDVLTRELQPQVAARLGYTDADGQLAVERFMRDYYLQARVLHRVSRRLVARCGEPFRRRSAVESSQRHQALADGLVYLDGALHLADGNPGLLRRDPVRILRVFWHLHRLGGGLSLDLERAVEDSLDVIDDALRRSPAARETLLDICRHWGRVAQTLTAMHELGVLGRYLPEFGALTCLVQYDAYHRFSADQHSLVAVEHLEALAPGQSAEAAGAGEVFGAIDRPDLLMLGMLLHDIGKARGHGHVAKGIPLARELAARLGLDAASAGLVEFLVAHHLTMSHVVQRRDLDDARTVADFAATVGTPERLRMLYLLTWADMRAVGPGVLTPWHAAVLHDLFVRTLIHLTGGRVERPSRAVLGERLQAVASAGRQAVKAHLGLVSERYLQTTGVERMAEHLGMLARLAGTPAVTEVFHHADLGWADLVVVTPDRPGLFALIAGALAACGVNIVSAEIHTRADGVAIDTFQVSDALGDAVTVEARWERTLETLRRVLGGADTVEALLARRRAGAAGRGPEPTGGRVTVNNDLSDEHTVVEVKCPDRLGLLWLVTRTLSGLELDIASARVATEIDQALDTFYVHGPRGRKLDDAACAAARTALERALVEPL